MIAAAPFALWLMYGHHGCHHSLPRIQIEMVTAAIEQYRIDTGHWPKSLDDLLDDASPGLGPYLKESSLRDRWNRPLFFGRDPDDRGFTVFSLGRDGRLGGRGADEDVGGAFREIE